MSPRRAAPQKKQSGLPSWFVPVGIGVVLVLAAIGLFLVQTPATPAPNNGGGLSASGRTAGDPNSKVAFAEFSDFQ
jgi:hypothetical protein